MAAKKMDFNNDYAAFHFSEWAASEFSINHRPQLRERYFGMASGGFSKAALMRYANEYNKNIVEKLLNKISAWGAYIASNESSNIDLMRASDFYKSSLSKGLNQIKKLEESLLEKFICPECGHKEKTFVHLFISPEPSDDPWSHVLQIVRCSGCSTGIPAHLGFLWGGISEADARTDWLSVYKRKN